MAISPGDIKVYLTGADSDGGAQSDPNASLGGNRSSSLKNTETAVNDIDGISGSDTTIVVASTTGFASSGYVSIESEIIQYTGTTSVSFTGCSRGALGTSAAGHDDNSPVLALPMETLFDHVSGSEASDGDTEYRCFCVKNTSGVDTAYNVQVYLGVATGNSDDDIAFAVEVPQTFLVTGSAQGPVATEGTAPSVNSGGVSDWSTASTRETGVGADQGSHGADLGPGEILYVWLRRTVAVGASAANNERYGIAVAFDTAA